MITTDKKVKTKGRAGGPWGQAGAGPQRGAGRQCASKACEECEGEGTHTCPGCDGNGACQNCDGEGTEPCPECVREPRNAPARQTQ